jgi:hypothetical protein
MPAAFDREIFDRIFLLHFDHAERRQSDYGSVQVTFPDGSGSDIGLSYVGSEISSVSFNHFGGKALFDAVYELAALTSSIVWWPSPASFSAVASEATLKELPKKGFRDLRLVKIVHSGAEISRVIDSSFSSLEPLASFCRDRL